MPTELTRPTSIDSPAEAADGPPLAPLARLTSRSDLVADALRSAILRGQLQPGETLVERKLADMLGVSKTPVREALIGLARSGLVTMNPNRGVTVRVVDSAALYEICEVRSQLEPWAVARTAETVREGSSGALEGARSAMRDADAAVERDDRAALTSINRRFHRSLYSWCGNGLVEAILDDLQDQLALGVVSLLWRRSPTWATEAEEHRAILNAVAAGDPARAETLMRDHIGRSLRSLHSHRTESAEGR